MDNESPGRSRTRCTAPTPKVVRLRYLSSTRLLERPHLLIAIVLGFAAAAFPAAISAHVASAQQSNTPSEATLDADAAQIAAKTDARLYVAKAADTYVSPARDVPPRSDLVLHVSGAHEAVPQRAVSHRAVSHRAVPHSSAAPVVQHSVAAAPPPVPTTTTTTQAQSGYGCASALAYLSAHAAPGFTFECPGYADGHQAMTCMNIQGLCPGADVIAIAVPCAAAYMNEASNSWVLTGKSDAPIDPYGYCHE